MSQSPALSSEDSTASPFSRRAALLLVAVGSLLFIALIWLMGAGYGFGSDNNGGAHAASKGLTGYYALGEYLERRGYTVRRARARTALEEPGLVILTPPVEAKGKDLARIVSARRDIGPTLIITPKWIEQRQSSGEPGARTGWVRLAGIGGPVWDGFLDELTLHQGRDAPPGGKAQWTATGLSGALPDPRRYFTGSGDDLVALVRGPARGEVLAGFVDDGGDYPELREMALNSVDSEDAEPGRYPVVVVFEPDLLNNYGMSHLENARLAEALVRATGVIPEGNVVFDLTFNGIGGSQNLLTLAFQPPFLAATLCLLLAALVIGWRGFVRFGPPLRGGPPIAFGKRALIANAAGLIRRSKRLHLLTGPYAERARMRLAHALALPRTLDPVAVDAAIDRAQRARATGDEPFSTVVARLLAARHATELLKAARDLHALEQRLTR